jgi:hypothetical protein
MKKTYNTEEALAPQGVMRNPVGEQPAMQQEQPTSPPLEGESGGESGGAELSQADQAYISGLMKLLHSKDTAPHVEEMLKSGPPEQTIPATALQINGQMEEAAGQKPPLETALIAGVYLVQDLIEIGNAAGYFELQDPEQMKPILQTTMQQYIEAGLQDGTIDPVELQEKVEPLMDEEQRATGMQAAELTGIPKAPTQETAMSAYGRQMERKGVMSGGKK